MKNIGIRIALLVTIIGSQFLAATAQAQSEQEKTKALILNKDSLFWNAFNSCDIASFKIFFVDDVEFYHDKGGITLDRAGIEANQKNNLCSNPDYHLRREAVPGTVNVYPLMKDNVIYGAIISGEHYFYITEKDKKEFKDGWAKFNHLWLLKDGNWKMSRILSYDHAAAPDLKTRKEMLLSTNQLDKLAGQYVRTDSKVLTVQRENNTLVLLNGAKRMVFYAASENNFFARELDFELEFVQQQNKVSSFRIIENGKMIETMIRK